MTIAPDVAPPRARWVFCGGMPRAGSTLQYQMARGLIERAGVGRRGGWLRPDETSSFVAAGPPAGLSTVKTHAIPDEVARACEAGRGLALYIRRDLRDVVCSHQRKQGVRLDGEALECFLELLIRRDARWRCLPSVHLARYEETVADLPGERPRGSPPF